jgi:hypothetical protein
MLKWHWALLITIGSFHGGCRDGQTEFGSVSSQLEIVYTAMLLSEGKKMSDCTEPELMHYYRSVLSNELSGRGLLDQELSRLLASNFDNIYLTRIPANWEPTGGESDPSVTERDLGVVAIMLEEGDFLLISGGNSLFRRRTLSATDWVKIRRDELGK